MKQHCSPDSLTLQLWRDRREREKGSPPSKGSLALNGYLGCETGFSLDRESMTLALILTEEVVVMALESKEALMRWQVMRKFMLLPFAVFAAFVAALARLLSGLAPLLDLFVQCRMLALRGRQSPLRLKGPHLG
jgi:hypothetical protein